jgi:hypothetical protein
MTDEELKAIRERAAKLARDVDEFHKGCVNAAANAPEECPDCAAAFLRASRETLPAVVADVSALLAEVDRLNAMIRGFFSSRPPPER